MYGLTVSYNNENIIDTNDDVAFTLTTKGKLMSDNVDIAFHKTSSWTLLGSKEQNINTTSTSAGPATTISIGSAAWTDAKIIYVRVRDKAGKRAGYFYGSDVFFVNVNAANGSTSTFSSSVKIVYRYSTSSVWGQYVSTTGYGVYGNSITSGGVVNIYRRYNSTNSLTIDGTYVIEVYALDYPDGVSPYDA